MTLSSSIDTPFPQLILKRGKDAPIRYRHMWIFSGAIESVIPYDLQDGSVVEVRNFERTDVLGYAVLNRKSSIAARVVSFTSHKAEIEIDRLIEKAFCLRKSLIPQIVEPHSTEMYRLVNAEGDGLSGLIIDMYGPSYAVIQISSLAMDVFRSHIVTTLQRLFPVKAIYEKSTNASRKLEGLKPEEKKLFGDVPDTVVATERGISYLIDIKKGQKTGFFIDQREMRSLIRAISFGKKVINCFSYSGGFSLNALKGGAQSVISLDVSQGALDLLHHSLELNSELHSTRHQSRAVDVFKWLEQGSENKELSTCDILILDPPAFAKTKKDVPNALKGYREINRRAFQNMKSGSLLLTCSCSYHVSYDEFNEMVYKAAADSKRDIRVLSHHRNALDHGSTIYHRETDYLKSMLVAIES